ncbi:VPS52 protein, partial [Alopecoenas beccarii]|nr:VPS52 protein [Alopecoenas beccarii]
QRMEQMLGAFQCDLSSISCEIRSLQEQSVAMTLRLRNRRAVRRQLGRLLDQLVVPPAMISTILEAPVTEPEFLEQLQELNGKIDSVKEQAFRETVACADVQHVLEKLKIKAVTKIREFVLQKIYSFRKPMTNYQIPQNALLKYSRFFYQFLLGNDRAVAQELREQYVDTMSKIYLSYFKSYTSRLMKIQAGLGGAWGGCWGHILGADPPFVLSPAVRGGGGERRSHGGGGHGQERYPAIIGERVIFGGHILELNIQSIQSTDPQKLGFLDTRPHYITRRYAEFSSAIVSINQTFPNEKTNALLGQLQVEVENFVLRVAAEFSSRKEQLIFLINNYDMMLGVLMERAVEESKEVEGFQQLLSARTQEFIEELLSPPFGGMIAFVKEAEALLEKGQLERLRGEEGKKTGGVLHFGDPPQILGFLRVFSPPPARVTQLARGFSSTWKASVESLSQDVMRSFSNFKNGTGIIQGALTQLIQYYHRFHKVLAQPPLRSLPVRADLINIHHLMVELKKHKPNF